MAEEKNNPFSVRMESDDKEKLMQLIQESGKSNKDFMNALISAYELNKVKIEVPEATESITKVEELTQLINDYFVNMSKQIRTTKEAMNLQFTRDLDIYKVRLETLKDDNSKLEDKIETVQAAYGNACNDIDELKKELESKDQLAAQLQESIKDKTSLVEEYKGKNDMLLTQLKTFEKYPEEVETLKQLLSDSQTKVIDAENKLKDNIRLIEGLNKDIDGLKNKYTEDIENLKNKHAAQLEDVKIKNGELLQNLKDKYEIEKDKAILSKDREHQKDLAEIQDKHNKEIEGYQAKYKQLLEEMEQLKASHKTVTKSK